MKNLRVATLLLLAVFVGACSTGGMTSAPHEPISQNVGAPESRESGRETVLLVSLDDGSVIMQRINSSADVCFKKNSDSATTCLTQGAPVIDPITNAVIGFEMIEDHIELVAKSD